MGGCDDRVYLTESVTPCIMNFTGFFFLFLFLENQKQEVLNYL